MIQAVTPLLKDAQIEASRVPPQSVEAEQSVLGGLLLENGAWDRIGDVIIPEDFYRADHRAIFQQIAQLIENNRPADALTVAESRRTTSPATATVASISRSAMNRTSLARSR
jgi:replicative DNA helicase